MAQQNKIPFYYQVKSGVIGALGTDTKTLIMAADSDFELTYFLGMSTTDAATDFSPNNFTVKVTDSSTGRLLTSDFINQRNFVGPSNGTLYQRYPVVFSALANVVFDFVNLVNGNNTVTIVMAGYKIFTPTVAA